MYSKRTWYALDWICTPTLAVQFGSQNARDQWVSQGENKSREAITATQARRLYIISEAAFADPILRSHAESEANHQAGREGCGKSQLSGGAIT